MRMISIITPCYNVEAYLARCIESIMCQVNTEISVQLILIDDGSQDGTRAIIEEYEKKYPENILAIYFDVNNGTSIARNVALEYCTGDMCLFVDSDDWIEPNTLEYVRNLLLKDNEIDIVQLNSDRPTGYGDIEPSPKDRIDVFSLKSDCERERFLCTHRLDIGIGGKVIRTSLFNEYEIQFPENLLYEDNYVLWILFEHARKVVYSNQVMYHWFINPNSTTSSGKSIFDRLAVQKFLIQRMRSDDVWEYDREIIEYNFWEKTFMELLYAIGMEKCATNIELIEEIRNIVSKEVPNIAVNRYFKNPASVQHFIGCECFKKLYLCKYITTQDVVECWKMFAKCISEGEQILHEHC